MRDVFKDPYFSVMVNIPSEEECPWMLRNPVFFGHGGIVHSRMREFLLTNKKTNKI
jgi:hypothetical protein